MVQAYKHKFMIGSMLNLTIKGMEMMMPTIVRELTEHVTAADADPNRGIFLLVVSFILQLVRHYMNELCFYNNFVTGFMITSTI